MAGRNSSPLFFYRVISYLREIIEFSGHRTGADTRRVAAQICPHDRDAVKGDCQLRWSLEAVAMPAGTGYFRLSNAIGSAASDQVSIGVLNIPGGRR